TVAEFSKLSPKLQQAKCFSTSAEINSFLSTEILEINVLCWRSFIVTCDNFVAEFFRYTSTFLLPFFTEMVSLEYPVKLTTSLSVFELGLIENFPFWSEIVPLVVPDQ